MVRRRCSYISEKKNSIVAHRVETGSKIIFR